MQRNHVTIRPLNREDSVLYFPPEAFGPFRVLHQIGAGTLGPVFRACEAGAQGSDRLVAVKVFRLDLTPEQSAALVDRFNAIIDAGLSHPSIAAPIAAGLERGAVYLAQEYAAGDSLDVVLRGRGPLPIRDAVALVDALAGAIDYAASKGVHHGSLHLRDVMLSADGVRVTGFGIAAALSQVSAKLPTRPEYAAPGGSSDVYSLGVIAFETVMGKRVSPHHLQELEAAHGVELRATFDAALAQNPELRPRRASDFAGALRTVPALAPNEPIASDALLTPDLDLQIDRPIDFTAESDIATPRAVIEERRTRWPMIAACLVLGLLAALSAGLFLRSRAPAAIADPEPAAVAETTVDLSANPSPAPVPPPTTARPSKPAEAAASPVAAARAQKPARGSLLIRSTPADADVFVNGRAGGKTPVAVRDLALGSYTIRVARDGFAAEERTLRLTPQRPAASTTFELRLASARGGINVLSRPPGARVFVNDRPVGSTPLAIPGFPAGPATVRIEMDGYQTWATTVGVSAGGQTRVAASLERK